MSETAAPAAVPAVPLVDADGTVVPACDDEFGCGAAAGQPCAPYCYAMQGFEGENDDADPPQN